VDINHARTQQLGESATERRRIAAYLRRWAADTAITGGPQTKIVALTLETAADFIDAGAHDRALAAQRRQLR
jgi:hypothetical protein